MSHGTDGTHMTMTMGGGILEIHGEKRLRTWTKLNYTANAGDNFIITSERVDFKQGEQIVITGSEIPSNGIFQEEVVTVISNDDYHTVYFDPPLIYTHRSEIVTVEGRVLDLRCEVGLLTRNFKIQGDENSDGQLFGSHMMAMSGTFKIENVEITRCGQAFNLGRYCSHAHHAGNFEGNYVKANSIHHSYQRAVTTHDTSYWEVRDNVAYDVMGHAYFVEDGDEYYNSISGNLGIRIKTSSALLVSDTKPAIFWTSNPNNFWYDNVAVHSHSFGFWFELPGTPPNVPGICCSSEHLGEFRNNTFRANGVLGLRIYPIWLPLTDPCNSSSPPAPQYLQKMLSYRNGGNGMFSKRHGDLHHIGHTFLENGGHDISIIHYLSVPYTLDPTFRDILFVATLDPHFNENTDLGKFAIWAPQEEYFYVKNSTFINYGTFGALSGCNDCDNGEEMAQDGHTYRWEKLRFIKTPRRIRWSPHFKQIFWDLDGSLGGVANSYLLQWYNFNAWSPLCSRLPFEVYDDTMLCANTTVRRLEIDYVEPDQTDFTDITIRSTAGNDEIYFYPKDIYGWVVPLVMNNSYLLDWFDSDISPYQFSLRLGCETYIQESQSKGINESLIIKFEPKPYNYIPWSFRVNYDTKTTYANITHSLSTNSKMSQSTYYNNTFEIMLTSEGAHNRLIEPYAVSVAAQLCPPQGCPIPPLPKLPKNYSLLNVNLP